MRKMLLLTAVVLLVFAVQTMANPIIWPPWGNIVPSLDMFGNDRFISDNAPGLITIHFILVDAIGIEAMACQFAAPKPSCFDAEFVSDTGVFPVTLGDSQTGVSIGFGQCLQVPIHVLSANYFGQGLTDECCYYWVQPHPDGTSGRVELVNCTPALLYGDGGAAIINPNVNQCIGDNPVESTTWGKVKSLYAK